MKLVAVVQRPALQERDIFSVVYGTYVQSEPDDSANVESGLALLKENNCDCVISWVAVPARLRERYRAGRGKWRQHP